jgi:hypothetical protein
MARTPSDYEKPNHAANIARPKMVHDLEKTSFPKTGPVSNKTKWPQAG